MKQKYVVISTILLVLAAGAISQTLAQTKTGSVEQELLKLASDWMDAEVKADMAFIDQFVAEECVITDPVGAVWTKDQFLGGG